MRLILRTIIIFCAAVVLSGGIASVKADVGSNVQSSEYLFHLYLNTTNQLVADRTFKFSYDIISAPFIQPPVGQFPYRAEIINLTGAIVANVKFNVQPGTVSVYAPYAADGEKAVFYDNQNQPVLTIPVSGSSFCNDDGICNADRGETYQTCPHDCEEGTLPATSVAPTSGTSSSSSTGLILGIIYIVIGLGLVGGYIWWRRRGKSGGSGTPWTPGSQNQTQLNTPSLPTPPPPAGPNNPV